MNAPEPNAEFDLSCEGGVTLRAYRWDPSGEVRGVLVLAHGMGEYACRHGRLARVFSGIGLVVYAHDERGHGQAALAAGTMGHFADHDGWRLAVSDIHSLQQYAAQQHPGCKVLFYGQSMGSMLGQEYLITHGSNLDGVFLAGTGGGQGALLRVAQTIALAERARLGPRKRSSVLDAITFGSYNRQFKPARTEFDWLTRDAAEVDKYIQDPLCGGTLTTQSWLDMFRGLSQVENVHRQALIPKGLPVFIFAGDRDPVGNNGKGPRWLHDRYRKVGMTAAELKLYPGARHEMPNETNREEVFADLVRFAESVLS